MAETKDQKSIRLLYQHFNARNIDALFKFLTEDVAWANGMERTHVHGKQAIREYWTHQWSVIDPNVDPLKFSDTQDGFVKADVHQVVKDLNGKVVLDEKVVHQFQMRDGLVQKFDILGPSQLSELEY